jgi:hypothetical protein
MRSLLAHWSRQLFDAISRVPPWSPLPHRRRGRAAGRPQVMALVHCGEPHSCTNRATAHGPCSHQRRMWGAVLAAGLLLTWLGRVPGTMAAQATLTIRAGTTVTWVNNDDDLHTVTSTQGLFASPGLDHGDTFAYRFTAPGMYPYFCALHPHMQGTIIVQ